MIELLEKALNVVREGTLPVMLPLVAVCLVMWIGIMERLNYLQGPLWRSFWPPARRRTSSLKELLGESFDIFLSHPNEANRRSLLKACKRLMTPYARFLMRVLGRKEIDSEELRELHITHASLESEIEIQRGLAIISTLAKSAPLLGLLGTVTGMIQTFRAMMFASTSDPRSLSSGISIALIATEVGLAVSITGVVFSSWLNRRAQTILQEINLAATRIFQTESEEEETTA